MTRYIVLYLFGIVLAAIAVSGDPPIRHRKTITLLWPLAAAVIVAADISTIINIILNRDKD